MLNWNNLDFNTIATDPNISVQIATEIESMSWIQSPFGSFTGKGANRGVRVYDVKNDQPYRPRLKNKLTGDGVDGNTDFETNFDNLEIVSQTIYPKVKGNALKSPIKQYTTMEQIDFTRESVDSLSTWIEEYRDRCIAAALMNDFTNIVCADAQKGFKDTTSEKSVQSATRKVAKGDVMNVEMIERAIYMASEGENYDGKEIFPIKPIKSDIKTEGGLRIAHNSYLVLLTGEQANQLKQDKKWQEMQKYADNRGENNRLFTGLLGMIDGTPIINMGNWTKQKVGMLRTNVKDSEFMQYINPLNFSKITPPSYYANNVDLSFGALIGASAIVMAQGENPTFYINQSADMGRKVEIGVDKLLAISKGRFANETGILSPFSNQDFAVIGLVSANN